MVEKLNESVKTVEQWFDDLVLSAVLTPQGNPSNPNCLWGQPIIFWGGSGIGKTERIEQLAERLGRVCGTVVPGQQQPEDFSEVLVPDPRSPDGYSYQFMISAFSQIMDAKGGILLFDEMSNAAPATQGASLGVIRKRAVGSRQLPPRTALIATANPPEIAAGGWGLEPPTANRFEHYFVGPDFTSFGDWYMTESTVDPVPIKDAESRIITAWPSVYPRVKGAIYGYLKSKTSDFYRQPAAGDPNGGFAWPSPRTWVATGRRIATRQILNMNDELDDVIAAGLVGSGAATSFMTWRRNADLPSPEDVLKNGWKPDTRRLDRTFAVYTSLVAYVGAINAKKEKARREEVGAKVWQALELLLDNTGAADLVMHATKSMVDKYSLGTDAGGECGRAAKAVLLKLAKTETATVV